jgi:hypothetical protein
MKTKQKHFLGFSVFSFLASKTKQMSMIRKCDVIVGVDILYLIVLII